MNMGQLKTVKIPQGAVRKIQCGSHILWEKKVDLVCKPYITMTVSKQGNTSKVKGYVRGISQELILDLSAYWGTNGTANAWVGSFSTEGKDTVKGYTTESYDRIAYSTTLYFKLELMYKDLDGNTKFLTTAVSSSGTVSAKAT